jgi:ornithine cyclodeaminase
MSIYINESEALKALTMSEAVALAEEAFLLFSKGEAYNTPRTRVRIRKGALHILPAALPTKDVMGYKAYTSFREGIISRFYLHSASNGELLAVLDSGEIGRMRTGAASGAASKYLSDTSSKHMTLFGAGYQAEAQLEAVLAVRKITDVDVINLTPEKGEKFAAEMSAKYGINVKRALDARESVSKADIISTVTWSTSPVINKDWALKPGVHINACGSNALIRAEVPEQLVERSLVVVDDKEVARLECGDIVPSLEKGRLHFNNIAELGDIISGRFPLPDYSVTTLFESQGMGLLDLICAEHIYRKAISEGFGTKLRL